MNKVFIASVLFIGISRTSLGSPSLNCSNVDPTLTSTVQCSCHNPGGLGIKWYRDDNYLTQCTKLNGLCFTYVGYTFAVDSSTSTYTMDFGSYSYTDCSNVSCSDSTTPSDSDLKTISVDESSLIPTISAISEPSSSHTDGNISFTTDCLYKARSTSISVAAKWKAVTVKGEHVLQVDETISEIGSCQSCSYDFASKFSIEFYHKEEQSDNKEEAQIRLELLLDGVPVSSLRKTTNNMYYVRVESDPTSDRWCGNMFTCIIVYIVFAILGVCLIVHLLVAIFKFDVILILYRERKGFIPCCLLIPIIGLFVICCIKCKTECHCDVTPCSEREQDTSYKLRIKDTGPHLKEEIEILEVNEKSINIGWKRCNDTNFKCYHLKYAEAERQKTINYHGEGYIEFTLSDLNESTSYNFILSWVDDHNVPHQLHQNNVRIDGPCENEDFSIKRDSKKDKSIIWKCSSFGRLPSTFILKYSGVEQMKPIHDDGKAFKSYTLSELNVATTYILGLSCIDKSNNEMKHIKFEPVRERTEGCPEPPKDFKLTKTRGEIVAKWAPGNDGGHQQHFVLIDADKQEQITEPFRNPFQKVIMYTVPILQNKTHLKLQVLSVNSKGTSESSIVEIEL